MATKSTTVNNKETTADTVTDEVTTTSTVPASAEEGTTPPTAPVSAESDFIKYRNEQLKLVRCKIYNNNPNNSDLSGRIYSIGNKKLGVISKYVPFHGPAAESYHIPYILYKALKRRKYTKISTTVNSKGVPVQTVAELPEFSIIELPPLTKQELGELAKKQALNRSIDTE